VARKYSRDNRGRFASGGTGATARGGRLKTASGGKRATQTMTAASSKPAGAITGRAARTAAGQKVMGKLVKRPTAKQQSRGMSKKPANKAQRTYLAAKSTARLRGNNPQGADARTRRMANSAASVVKGMERRRSSVVPKAAANSPRTMQQQRQVARMQRANRNSQSAWARESDGPNSKASRSATVARRAQQIYSGKVDPKVKTKSRLTKTGNPEALRKRIAKIKDNATRAAGKNNRRR
jgi:hypothetical protein